MWPRRSTPRARRIRFQPNRSGSRPARHDLHRRIREIDQSQDVRSSRLGRHRALRQVASQLKDFTSSLFRPCSPREWVTKGLGLVSFFFFHRFFLLRMGPLALLEVRQGESDWASGWESWGWGCFGYAPLLGAFIGWALNRSSSPIWQHFPLSGSLGAGKTLRLKLVSFRIRTLEVYGWREWGISRMEYDCYGIYLI